MNYTDDYAPVKNALIRRVINDTRIPDWYIDALPWYLKSHLTTGCSLMAVIVQDMMVVASEVLGE